MKLPIRLIGGFVGIIVVVAVVFLLINFGVINIFNNGNTPDNGSNTDDDDDGVSEYDPPRITKILTASSIVSGKPTQKTVFEQGDTIYVYYEFDRVVHNGTYDLVEDIKSALFGMLAPKFEEKIIGLAEVREVFRSSKLGAIAGCMVIDGVVKRNNPIRVLRDNVVIYEGELESLRRFKEDVAEVRNATECGIGVKNYNDIKVGDQIEVYERVLVKRKI